MKYMDITESRELLGWHAFKTPSPTESYADLCKDYVEYCGGLSLALEVIRSFLLDRSVAEWKNALKKLKTIPNDIIIGKL
ncbi:putative P-loop containing nucleoside triphosphate hydrolase [Medicago truncatula]|uniref:Putative P-loop containing nucleoside triphosphate hydrolase n=1 Tax=Medicago truncatula TaxID=3880 RepID=G7JDC2_MEDTR|nr:TIR-NBS-LRR class disease resistance protein [Medicago truncatula]RHN59198.1 putative P-loop containing nucleoside triphosphate hydrolase [Medicago truncatula]